MTNSGLASDFELGIWGLVGSWGLAIGISTSSGMRNARSALTEVYCSVYSTFGHLSLQPADSERHPRILPLQGVRSGGCWGGLSGRLPGRLSTTLSGRLSGRLSGALSGRPSGRLSTPLSGTLSSRLSGRLPSGLSTPLSTPLSTGRSTPLSTPLRGGLR